MLDICLICVVLNMCLRYMYVNIISVYTVHDCQENKYMNYILFEQNTDTE